MAEPGETRSAMSRTRLVDLVLAILSAALIAVSGWTLWKSRDGLAVDAITVGTTPVTVFRPIAGAHGPVVVIAHGFAGSQQLMQAFATTFARNGYVAVTFDLPGHGRNPEPMTGNLADLEGATRRLVAETSAVADFAKSLGDGRIALLGHSMDSDIVIRTAQARSDVVATIAVSMFSPAATATSPRDLLVIAGDWEGMLKREALRVVGLASAPAAAEPWTTYGDLGAGTARRAAISPHVEHVGVLYSPASMSEALAWLDSAFAVRRDASPYLDKRGGWILLLLLGIVVLARPLSGLLPVVAARRCGAALPWRALWPVVVIPPVVTPLVLRVLPTHVLPVLVGDYLAAHFALYGLTTALLVWWSSRRRIAAPPSGMIPGALALAAILATSFAIGVLGTAIDLTVTSFAAIPARFVLIAAMALGTLTYFLADEWATRGDGAGRGAYVATKLAFLLSLAAAIALNFHRLFFLIIIVPVILVLFIVFGLFSAWIYRRTRHPLVAGFANGAFFAFAIGVTFPMIAG